MRITVNNKKDYFSLVLNHLKRDNFCENVVKEVKIMLAIDRTTPGSPCFYNNNRSQPSTPTFASCKKIPSTTSFPDMLPPGNSSNNEEISGIFASACEALKIASDQVDRSGTRGLVRGAAIFAGGTVTIIGYYLFPWKGAE
jgi:hypothetical protein